MVLFVYKYMSTCKALIFNIIFIHNINILEPTLQPTELKLPFFNTKTTRVYLQNYSGF